MSKRITPDSIWNEVVKESFGARATTSLDYSASYKVVQLKESEDIIQSYTKISKKTFSEFISMKCASDKKYYFKILSFRRRSGVGF